MGDASQMGMVPPPFIFYWRYTMCEYVCNNFYALGSIGDYNTPQKLDQKIVVNKIE